MQTLLIVSVVSINTNTIKYLLVVPAAFLVVTSVLVFVYINVMVVSTAGSTSISSISPKTIRSIATLLPIEALLFVQK